MNNNLATKCLVIGANGFIGSHLVDELVERGVQVRAFDRYSKEPQFKSNTQIEVFKGDLFDDITFSKALVGMDYMVHCFSATTPSSADADPYTDLNVNLLRNVQLFERAVEADIKKVAFISSGGAVYGHLAEQKKASEEDAPTPVSPYGISKLASEHFLAYFNRKYGLDYVVYRLSNPYGPRQAIRRNQGIIPAFLERINNREELTVVGDGSSSRDYIYIKDAVTMIAESFFMTTKFKTYNIGSGQQTSINDIISTLQEVLKTTLKVNHIEQPKTFLTKTQIDISKFENEFQSRPTTLLSGGLRLTIESLDS